MKKCYWLWVGVLLALVAPGGPGQVAEAQAVPGGTAWPPLDQGQPAPARSFELEAVLAPAPGSPTPSASGKAVFSEGSERKLKVEVENARELAGQTVMVLVDGRGWRQIGRLDPLGNVRLSSYADSEYLAVKFAPGTQLDVLAPDGTAVLSGTFQ